MIPMELHQFLYERSPRSVSLTVERPFRLQGTRVIPILFGRTHNRVPALLKLFAFMGPILIIIFFRAEARTDPHQWGQISCSLFIYHRASRSSYKRDYRLEVFASIFFYVVWLCMICTKLYFVISTVILLPDQHKINMKQQYSIPLYMTPNYNSNSTIPYYHRNSTVHTPLLLSLFPARPAKQPLSREIRTIRQVPP